jgi:hypothetical protein
MGKAAVRNDRSKHAQQAYLEIANSCLFPHALTPACIHLHLKIDLSL